MGRRFSELVARRSALDEGRGRGGQPPLLVGRLALEERDGRSRAAPPCALLVIVNWCCLGGGGGGAARLPTCVDRCMATYDRSGGGRLGSAPPPPTEPSVLELVCSVIDSTALSSDLAPFDSSFLTPPQVSQLGTDASPLQWHALSVWL